jgi:hypothetical protein
VLKRFNRPIVVNGDDNTGPRAAASLADDVAGGAGYGLCLRATTRWFLFAFYVAADDPVFYATLSRITSAGRSSLQTPTVQTAKHYFPPPDTAGDWRTPASADEARRITGIGVAQLDKSLEVAKASTKNGGILVVKSGWLVYEGYFGLAHGDATPNLASCGKSFTSVAAGILMSESPDSFPRDATDRHAADSEAEPHRDRHSHRGQIAP